MKFQHYYIELYCNLRTFMGLFQTQIFTCLCDFLHIFAGISSLEMVIMAWNVDIMFLQYLYQCNWNTYWRLFVLYLS